MDYATLGMNLGGMAIGEGMGILNSQLQLNNNQEMLNQQVTANEKLADYQEGINRQMWDYTNYENQVKHLQNAGLNPALLYGKGGGGGMSVGTGSTGVAAQNAPNPSQSVAMGLQLTQNMAQNELMKAEANKANAEANALNGWQKDKGVAETNLTIAKTDNVNANTAIAEVNKQIQDVALKASQGTLDSVIESAKDNKKILDEQLDALKRNNDINEATKQTSIDQAKINYTLSLLDGALKNSQINVNNSIVKVNDQEIKQGVAKIAQGWEALRLEGLHITVEQGELKIMQGNLKVNEANSRIGQAAQMLNKEIHNLDDRTRFGIDKTVQILTFGLATASEMPQTPQQRPQIGFKKY
jgi:hypothetical protein